MYVCTKCSRPNGTFRQFVAAALNMFVYIYVYAFACVYVSGVYVQQRTILYLSRRKRRATVARLHTIFIFNAHITHTLIPHMRIPSQLAPKRVGVVVHVIGSASQHYIVRKWINLARTEGFIFLQFIARMSNIFGRNGLSLTKFDLISLFVYTVLTFMLDAFECHPNWAIIPDHRVLALQIKRHSFTSVNTCSDLLIIAM